MIQHVSLFTPAAIAGGVSRQPKVDELVTTVRSALDSWKPTIAAYAECFGLKAQDIAKAYVTQFSWGSGDEYPNLMKADVKVGLKSEIDTQYLGPTQLGRFVFAHGSQLSFRESPIRHVTSSTSVDLDPLLYMHIKNSSAAEAYSSLKAVIGVIFKINNHDLFHACVDLSAKPSTFVDQALYQRLRAIENFKGIHDGVALPGIALEIAPLVLHKQAVLGSLTNTNPLGITSFEEVSTVMNLATLKLSELAQALQASTDPYLLERKDDIVAYMFGAIYKGCCAAFGHASPWSNMLVNEARKIMITAEPDKVFRSDLEQSALKHDQELEYSKEHKGALDQIFAGQSSILLNPIDAMVLEVQFSGTGFWRLLSNNRILMGRDPAAVRGEFAKIITAFAGVKPSDLTGQYRERLELLQSALG